MPGCTVAGLACDGKTDDTAALQAALTACAAEQAALVLPAGRTCLSLPVVLPSHTLLQIPSSSVLKAGDSHRWPNTSATKAAAFLSASNGAKNITIQGQGTIDGSGEQWWTGSNKTPRRPRMLALRGVTKVLLEDFLLLNGAAWHAELSGVDHRIYGVRIKSPDYRTVALKPTRTSNPNSSLNLNLNPNHNSKL